MKKRVIIINEDLTVCKEMKYSLQNEETDASYFTSALEALTCFLKYPYHLVIMDLKLTETDGLALVELMRKAKSVPILALSCSADTVEQVEALRAGADLVLWRESVGMENLLAHARALIRRYTVFGSENSSAYTLAFASGLVIDPDSRIVTLHGEPLEVTRRGFDILFYLASNAGRVLRRENIYLHVWPEDKAYDVDSTVNFHIKILRKKLKDHQRKMIETVWGVGYRFNAKHGIESKNF